MKWLATGWILGAAFFSLGAAADPVLSIGSDTVGVGGTSTVALDISGLTPGTAIGTFDVNVGFNSSLLSLNSASFGDPMLGDQLNLEGFGTVNGTNTGTGTAELYEISLDDPSVLAALQPSSFTLATLTFAAIGSGLSALDLSINAIGDQLGNAITPSLSNGSIDVSAPPGGGGGGGGGSVSAPEIDPASAIGALTLLAGGLAVIRGRRSRLP